MFCCSSREDGKENRTRPGPQTAHHHREQAPPQGGGKPVGVVRTPFCEKIAPQLFGWNDPPEALLDMGGCAACIFSPSGRSLLLDSCELLCLMLIETCLNCGSSFSRPDYPIAAGDCVPAGQHGGASCEVTCSWGSC